MSSETNEVYLKSAPIQWQYCQAFFNLCDGYTDQFQVLGEQGWELVTILECTPDPYSHVAIFKRPRS